MDKLPILSGREIIKILSKVGFYFHHQKGSHIVLKRDKSPFTRVVVPDHTTLMMTNRYCQAVGCLDAVEAHKRYSPVDRIKI